MPEYDDCEFCGAGIPQGRSCSCAGAQAARKNHGRPDNVPEVTVLSTTDDTRVEFDEEQ